MNIISDCAGELSAQSSQVMQGASIQSDRTRETFASMEQMSSSMLEVARSAAQAAESAGQAKGKVLNGTLIMDKVVNAISEIHAEATTMKDILHSLDKKAGNIDEIMNMITDIADQTNLLALNAAIEAARAGEAGRGFAVVADEVRKLADKTVLATKEVGLAVNAIQDESHKAMQGMDGAAKAVESSNPLAQEAGSALQEIMEIVDNATDQAQSIASASEQQVVVSKQVNQAMGDISRITDETAQGMAETEKNIARMAEMSNLLILLTDKLRTG